MKTKENPYKQWSPTQRVGNEIPVAIPSLPDDNLGVEHDEATEDSQADIDVRLK